MKYTSLFIIVMACVILTWVQPGQTFEKKLLMATTTSTENTGLLDYLMPSFSASTGIDIVWTSVGTGKALKLGENCDVDVLLVHAPQVEFEFMESGFGVDRQEIMYNDFILIGPPDDPAGIKGKSVTEAVRAIFSTKTIFVSRGDNSGTNKKEQELWKRANLPAPEQESWYVQSGQGMLATINVAVELLGYTLADRGTYIKFESAVDSKPALILMVAGDEVLQNQYSVILVNPKRCPNVKYEKAKIFSEWMAGEKGQGMIGEFKLLGRQLFSPNAIRQ